MSGSIIDPNKTKRALRDGQLVTGTMLIEFRQPAVMQALHLAGLDFVTIDTEHGTFSLESVAELSRFARYVGITPLVRVPALDYVYIAQSLDVGAQGVMVPRLVNAEQVREAVQIMKYPPVGRRGTALNRGHTNFRSGPLAETMAAANEETMLIIQIETAEAAEQIEAIAAVPGVDVLLLGPTDLSIALGVPGQMNAPVLQSAVQNMIAACQRHHVTPGIHLSDVDTGVYWIQQGMKLISSFSEVSFVTRGASDANQAFRNAAGR